MDELTLYMHFKRKKDEEKMRLQGGDDDRELLSVSLTQSGQLYVCTSYLSFSSFFRFFSFCPVCSKILLAVICVCAVSCAMSHTHIHIHHELSTQLSHCIARIKRTNHMTYTYL
jgi:hypothetical protein